jgi:hypothetical protein
MALLIHHDVVESLTNIKSVKVSKYSRTAKM